MKKLLLFGIVLSIGILGYSQSRVEKVDLLVEKGIAIAAEAPTGLFEFRKNVNPYVHQERMEPAEEVAGKSIYDICSNGALSNRIHLYPDGTIGAVWTMGFEDAAFPDRGTGYNYYDGTEWTIPETNEQRIEIGEPGDVRTGWPNYAPWGPNGEIVVSHFTSTTGLAILTRENKGTGEWSQAEYDDESVESDPTWPRIVASGDDNEWTHIFYDTYNEYEGQSTALLYNRTLDGGETWETESELLEGLGSDYYTFISADQYTMASRGDMVVVLIADKWHDIFFLKSEDNGESWVKTMIAEHPYPYFDFDVTLTDTFWWCDGSHDVAIGPDGKVHAVFSLGLYLRNEEHEPGYYSPFYGTGVDGVVYWNEDMEQFGGDDLCDPETFSPPWYQEPLSELNDDPELGVVNLIGYTLDYNGNGTLDFENENIFVYDGQGLSTMPNIMVDNNNHVYTVWASATETFDNGTYQYRKIWTRAFANEAWGPFFHVTENIIHIIEESVYPVFAENSDDNAHILYRSDGTPGEASTPEPDHEFQENRYWYAAQPKSDLLTGIRNFETLDDNWVSQNYPNPFTEYTSITVTLEKSANLSITVMNQLGQVVYENDKGIMQAGNHLLRIDGTNLQSGIYFYTVETGLNTVTRKMIVN